MNIFFDVDDTLYDQLVPFKRAFEKHFPELDLPLEELFLLSRRYSEKAYVLQLAGQLTQEGLFIYRLQKSMADYGQTVSEEQALDFQASYQQFQREIVLVPELQEIMDAAKAKAVTLGIISNGVSEAQRRKINKLDVTPWIPEENIFVSSEIGFTKPDIRVFKYIESKMSINKAETYFIGDSFQTDIIGADEAKWQSIWLKRLSQPNIQCEVQPTYTVEGYQELRDFVLNLISNHESVN